MPSTACRSLYLAVTPLVKHVVLKETGGNPLYVSREQEKPFNPYAPYLFALLERRQLGHADVRHELPEYKTLTETLPILIPEWQVKFGPGGEITPAREIAFSTYVTNLFRQGLREKIALRMELSQKLKQAARATLEHYGVGEDLYPIDAAVRHYYRHQ